MNLVEIRREYHRNICDGIIRISHDPKKKNDYPNFADSGNRSSIGIACGIVELLGHEIASKPITGQEIGGLFEEITRNFLQNAFELLQHIRPGKWNYSVEYPISHFSQYEHLSYLEKIIKDNKVLASSLGGDYIIKPDIVIGREAISDEEINLNSVLVKEGDEMATLTPLRKINRTSQCPILHASISCKWTIRSDRVQNARTEALNLIRNRKGNVPHIVTVTAEPLPTRIASLALGTGDLDCVYHFALPELQKAILKVDNEDQLDMLNMLVDGKRLRDISDLPFDLAV